jgi:ATP-dependent RNA helicase HelY
MLADRREERADLSSADAPQDDHARREAAETTDLASDIEDAVAALLPGDVVVDPGRASVGRLVVVAEPRVRRGQSALDTVRPDSRRVVIGAKDFRLPPTVVGRLPLGDLRPGERGFARTVAARLRDLPEDPHPNAAPPAERLRKGEVPWAVRRQRLDEEIATIEARLQEEEAAHEHEFDAVADLLRRRQHLDGWSLTESGRMVRRLFHERGLLVAECLAAGVFDDLDVPSLAAAVSAFRSGTRQDLAPSPFPTPTLRARWRRIEEVVDDLQRCESDLGLPITPHPDSALLTPIHRWTAGADLATALRSSALGPGDLAREVRQVLELLEQVAVVAPPPIASAAEAGIVAMSRGIVVATAHPEGRDVAVAGTAWT